jgi:hypothetical protein
MTWFLRFFLLLLFCPLGCFSSDTPCIFGFLIVPFEVSLHFMFSVYWTGGWVNWISKGRGSRLNAGVDGMSLPVVKLSGW